MWQFEISPSLTPPALADNCSLLKLSLCTNVSIARTVPTYSCACVQKLILCVLACTCMSVSMSVLTCVYVLGVQILNSTNIYLHVVVLINSIYMKILFENQH
jgi:hypothetical protein